MVNIVNLILEIEYMKFTKVVNSGPSRSLHEGVAFISDFSLVTVLVIPNTVSL